jgi:hypothetical protein
MSITLATEARARAEALFKQPHAATAQVSVAMAEYRATERARYDRMCELRAQRLARDARFPRGA